MGKYIFFRYNTTYLIFLNSSLTFGYFTAFTDESIKPSFFYFIIFMMSILFLINFMRIGIGRDGISNRLIFSNKKYITIIEIPWSALDLDLPFGWPVYAINLGGVGTIPFFIRNVTKDYYKACYLMSKYGHKARYYGKDAKKYFEKIQDKLEKYEGLD